MVHAWRQTQRHPWGQTEWAYGPQVSSHHHRRLCSHLLLPLPPLLPLCSQGVADSGIWYLNFADGSVVAAAAVQVVEEAEWSETQMTLELGLRHWPPIFQNAYVASQGCCGLVTVGLKAVIAQSLTPH